MNYPAGKTNANELEKKSDGLGNNSSEYKKYWTVGGDHSPQSARAESRQYSHMEAANLTDKNVNPADI